MIVYQPRYRVTGSPTWINFGPQITTAPFTVTVTGLAGSTGYDFDVLAINSFGSTASATVTATTTTSATESVEGTTITASNRTTQFIYNASLLQYSLTSGGQVATSPPPYTTVTPDASTSGVTEILHHNHTVFQENTGNNWFYWSGTAWVATLDITGILIAGSTTPTFVFGASGQTVGALTATITGTTPAFSGTFAVTGGADAAFFTVSGGNLVTTQTTTARTYSINITATQANIVGSPLTQSFGIAGLATRLVFAQFEMGTSAYGNTVAGYTQDIMDAQAIGVDGFMIDLSGWLVNTFENFQQLAGFWFTAAANLGTGFKLCIFIDWQGRSGETNASAGDALTALVSHPNYFYFNGRPVVSAYQTSMDATIGGANDTFWSAVHTSLVNTGLNPLYMPTFTPNIGFPDQATVNAGFESWYTGGFLNGNIDGLACWGTLGTTGQTYFNQGAITLGKNHNLVICAAVQAWFSPIRFLSLGEVTTNMNVVDYNGGEGIAAQWEALINGAIVPPMVTFPSWGDVTETYISPATVAQWTATGTTNNEDVNLWEVTPDYINRHDGYWAYHKYFIQWYKTGVQPATWPDSMYVFYRNGSRNLVPTDPTVPPNSINNWDSNGTTLDDLYVTTILTAPATLTITTGGTPHVFAVGAGLVHTRQPFAVGAQTFVLTRGSTTLISITGTNVVGTQAKFYNTNPYTYYGHNPPQTP